MNERSTVIRGGAGRMTAKAATCLSLAGMTLALTTAIAPDAAATAPIGVTASVLSKNTT